MGRLITATPASDDGVAAGGLGFSCCRKRWPVRCARSTASRFSAFVLVEHVERHALLSVSTLPLALSPIIPAETAHLVRNESTSVSAKAPVVFSRSATDKHLLVVVKR